MFLSDTKIVRHIKLKLDMNPHLDKNYFISRKLKLRVRKLTGMAKNVLEKAKNICKPETMTMTNNCCPN
jgi:RNA-directed DNA polymerase